MTKTQVEGPPVYQRLRQHPTNDPTNPAHRLADDAKRMATGSYPANSAALQGIAEDIDVMLTAHAAAASRIEELERALGACRTELHYCAQQLAHRGLKGHPGDSVSRALEAATQAISDKG